MVASTGSSHPGGGLVPPVEIDGVFCVWGALLPSTVAGRTGWRMMVDSEIDSLTGRAYSARIAARKSPAEGKRLSGALAIERATMESYLGQRRAVSDSEGGAGS